MVRTTQPLVIAVAPRWARHPAIEELRAAGHRIVEVSEPVDSADLILHPAAHGWSDEMFEAFWRKNGTQYRPYTEAAVKAARSRKKGSR